MIYCPKCGTANRRGSRFCNECGETLPLGTALRCPMCGTMNPVGNVYCDQCNARLTPMKVPPPGESEREQTPIKGLSLPTIPLEEEREQQVEGVTKRVEMEEEGENEIAGDWLAQLRASEEEEGEEEEWPDVIAESIEPVELPDWLRDMGPIDMEAQATPGKEQSAAEAPLEEEAPAVPPPTPAEIPGWLQEIAPSEAAPPEATPTVIEPAPEEPAPDMPAPAEIPDWLQEIVPSEVAPPEV
ncbi:MAG: zinc ribbon domain-containing protein, partial [Chloroflexi bacterium]|nr:zinc ribbon domain-containing protein [Chloroflexota bacterium]